jgi:hypothetical protein
MTPKEPLGSNEQSKYYESYVCEPLQTHRRTPALTNTAQDLTRHQNLNHAWSKRSTIRVDEHGARVPVLLQDWPGNAVTGDVTVIDSDDTTPRRNTLFPLPPRQKLFHRYDRDSVFI